MIQDNRTSQKAALRLVILLGIVSLCANATYEGARSIIGPYLGVLGASATVVGLLAGFAELIAYILPLTLGYLADKIRQYWAITTLGYVINTASVPLLVFSGLWQVAAGLIIAQGTGKAILTPFRDVFLFQGALTLGPVLGFGFHQVLAQIGALIGPLSVATALYFKQGYEGSFSILVAPALLGLGVILVTQRVYPNTPQWQFSDLQEVKDQNLPIVCWIYFAALALIAAGSADFPLMAFHFKNGAGVAEGEIALFYGFALGVESIATLLFWRFFDRFGISILAGAVLLSSLCSPFIFIGHSQFILFGLTLWGIGMGAQVSIIKPIIAMMVSGEKRGFAYGIFNGCYGVSWFLGSALMGALYDYAPGALVLFSMVIQLASIPLLLLCRQLLR